MTAGDGTLETLGVRIPKRFLATTAFKALQMSDRNGITPPPHNHLTYLNRSHGNLSLNIWNYPLDTFSWK